MERFSFHIYVWLSSSLSSTSIGECSQCPPLLGEPPDLPSSLGRPIQSSSSPGFQGFLFICCSIVLFFSAGSGGGGCCWSLLVYFFPLHSITILVTSGALIFYVLITAFFVTSSSLFLADPAISWHHSASSNYWGPPTHCSWIQVPMWNPLDSILLGIQYSFLSNDGQWFHWHTILFHLVCQNYMVALSFCWEIAHRHLGCVALVGSCGICCGFIAWQVPLAVPIHS